MAAGCDAGSPVYRDESQLLNGLRAIQLQV